MPDKKRRKIIDLFRKYEGMKLDYGRDCSYSELAREWKLNRATISNWYNGVTSIPEERIVWAYRRYKKIGLCCDELMNTMLGDFPAHELAGKIDSIRK